MRKSVFFILLATASMPALAAGPNDPDRGDRQAARAEQRAARVDRSDSGDSSDNKSPGQERAARVERVEPVQNAQRVERAEVKAAPRVEPVRPSLQSSGQLDRRSVNEAARRNRIEARSIDKNVSAPEIRPQRGDRPTNWQVHERRVVAGTTPTIPTTTTTRPTTNSHYDGSHHDGDHHWSGDWRHDHRYDWHSYRNRYSSLYRLGRYYDPFGYGYRRFSIGYNLWPSYYNNNYWLSDPWQYRLPPAYGPYRWVRYYNDALLVDIYSGEVVDVIYGFFW
jgi:hypothetical protein